MIKHIHSTHDNPNANGSSGGKTVLRKEDHQQFADQGYLLVENILDPEIDIEPLEKEYSAVLDREAAALFAEGKLPSLYTELPFLERFSKILSLGDLSHQPFDICFPPKFAQDTPIHLGPAVFHHVLRNPRILDVIEELIGPEIYSNPVQHIRIKPPQKDVPEANHNALIAATGWHQDLGVIDEEADQSRIFTVWVAVTEATLNNSCLTVIPGSHKGDLVPHCSEGDQAGNHKPLVIPKRHLAKAEAIPLPVPAGAIILFDSRVMHAARPNETDSIRWSFDLRYNPIGQPSGRSWYPGFVARSRSNSESELHDAEAWAESWRQIRRDLARDGTHDRPFTRWSADHPGCA